MTRCVAMAYVCGDTFRGEWRASKRNGRGTLQLARVVGGCLIRRHLTRHIDDDLSPSRSARRRQRQREMSMPT